MTTELTIPGYDIEQVIARGGMAVIYKAEQISLGREVAIKVFDPQSSDATFAERFLQEARLVARLNHTGIITIYDFGSLESGKLFLIMEYLPNGDLEKRLEAGVTETDAVNIIKELAIALKFVHGQDVVHRDIKPANILFRNDGTLVLTDFGIAKKVNNEVTMTQAGMTVGSPAYSSPEQAQGQELDQRADIYSLGVMFLEMLTGENPFKCDTYIDTAIKHIQMAVPQLAPQFSRYQWLLEKMLAKKPSDRLSSMKELLEILEQLEKPAAAPQNVNMSYEESGLDDLLNEELERMELDDLLEEEIQRIDNELG